MLHILSRLYLFLPMTAPVLFQVHPLAPLPSPGSGLPTPWSGPRLPLWMPTVSTPSGSLTLTMSQSVTSLCLASPSIHYERYEAVRSFVRPSLSLGCTRRCLMMKSPRSSPACPTTQLANQYPNHTEVPASTDPARAGMVCVRTTRSRLSDLLLLPPPLCSNHALATIQTLNGQLQLPLWLVQGACGAQIQPSTSKKRLRS